MTTDKVTKILLALITLGLFVNALNPWLRPMPTAAATQIDELSGIATSVKSIDVRLSHLLKGGAGCLNTKICD
jgi:hypothetical protein